MGVWACSRKTDTVHSYEPEVIKQTPKLVEAPLPKATTKADYVPHKKVRTWQQKQSEGSIKYCWN